MKTIVKTNTVFIWLILIILSIIYCATFSKYGKLEKSARDHYTAGRFDSAVFECAQSLRSNPNYEKAQNLIQDAFKSAVNSHERNINDLKSSTMPFKWDDIVSHYESLNSARDSLCQRI